MLRVGSASISFLFHGVSVGMMQLLAHYKASQVRKPVQDSVFRILHLRSVRWAEYSCLTWQRCELEQVYVSVGLLPYSGYSLNL